MPQSQTSVPTAQSVPASQAPSFSYKHVPFCAVHIIASIPPDQPSLAESLSQSECVPSCSCFDFSTPSSSNSYVWPVMHPVTPPGS